MAKISHLHKNIDGMTVDYEIETLVQNNTSTSRVRERLSNIWLLQAKLTEALGNLSLKIPTALRDGEDFHTIVKVGNELKVVSVEPSANCPSS